MNFACFTNSLYSSIIVIFPLNACNSVTINTLLKLKVVGNAEWKSCNNCNKETHRLRLSQLPLLYFTKFDFWTWSFKRSSFIKYSLMKSLSNCLVKKTVCKFYYNSTLYKKNHAYLFMKFTLFSANWQILSSNLKTILAYL